MSDPIDGDDGQTDGGGAQPPQRTPQELQFRQQYEIPDDVSIEDYGREIGWVPQDEYRGDQSKWKPVEKFIEFGQRNHQVLKADNRKLNSENVQMRKQLADQQKAIDELNEFVTGTKKAIGERKRENLLEAKAAALESGNHREVIRLDEELRRLDKEAAPAPKPADAPAQEHPIVQQYRKDNPWYGTDLMMTAEADQLGDYLVATAKRLNQPIDPQEVLNNVVGAMKRRYPEKFGSTAPNGGGSPPPTDTRGGTAGGAPFTSANVRGGKKQPIYANLPPEAKAAVDRFIQKGILKVNQKDPKDIERVRNGYAVRFFQQNPDGKLPEQ